MATKPVSNKPSRLWAFAWYGFYTLVLILVFSYFLFPYDRMQLWLEQQIQQQIGLTIQAPDRNAGPFWFEWRRARFSMGVPSHLDNIVWPLVHVEFHPSALLNRTLELTNSLALLDGAGQGHIRMSLQSQEPRYALAQFITRLDLAHLEIPLFLKGRASGNLTFHWQEDRVFAGQGDLEVDFSDVQTREITGFDQPFPSMHFSSLSGKLSLQDTRLHLQTLQAVGQELTLSGQGTVSLNQNLSDSQLEGTFNLSLGPQIFQQYPQLGFLNLAPDQPFPITIAGTLGEPSLKIQDTPIQFQLDTAMIDRLSPYMSLRREQMNANRKEDRIP